MNAVPILRRELLVLARRPWFYWLRTGVGTAIALVSCVVFTITANTAPTAAGLGGPLFLTVTTMSYVLSLLAGPVLLADSVADEKSAGTLGLLFLTNTRSHDIVGGKFAAQALPALHCLLASLPILAIAFFLGGVTAGEFFRTALALLNVLFLSLAAAICCSVFARNGRQAFAGALLIVLITGALLPAPVLLGPGSNWADGWLTRWLASPALGLWLARDATYALNSSGFLAALLGGQLMGWGLLFTAIWLLPRYWHTEPVTTRPPQSTFLQRLPRLTDDTKNPVRWLAVQRLGGAWSAWLMTAATIAMTLACHATVGPMGAMLIPLLAYAAHGVFKLWVAWIASHAFGTERDSGALELLMVTPLGETAVWQAWLAGLRQRFLLPALALAVFDLGFAWLLAFRPDDGIIRMEIFFLTFLGVIIFLVDCYALSWSGLWNGLAARNATRAVMRTLLGWVVAPGMLFVTVVMASALVGALNTDSLILFVVLWATASFILDVIVGSFAMVRLSHDSRDAALRQHLKKVL
jgi:ABC-type transport system involved in multi-copper enzyme maturation permease subunit